MEPEPAPTLPELTARPLVRTCRRAHRYLLVAHGTALRLLASGLDEDHPFRRDDQLRSMLVFACAGMDRVCKALIEDALPEISMVSVGPERAVAKWAERFLAPGGPVSAPVLARVLLDAHIPREVLLREYREELTGDSMQSVEQLFRVEIALQLSTNYVKAHKNDLAETFRVRNLIVHEMDLDSSATAGTRYKRTIAEYVRLAAEALAVADHLVQSTSSSIRLLYEGQENAWIFSEERAELAALDAAYVAAKPPT